MGAAGVRRDTTSPVACRGCGARTALLLSFGSQEQEFRNKPRLKVSHTGSPSTKHGLEDAFAVMRQLRCLSRAGARHWRRCTTMAHSSKASSFGGFLVHLVRRSYVSIYMYIYISRSIYLYTYIYIYRGCCRNQCVEWPRGCFFFPCSARQQRRWTCLRRPCPPTTRVVARPGLSFGTQVLRTRMVLLDAIIRFAELVAACCLSCLSESRRL